MSAYRPASTSPPTDTHNSNHHHHHGGGGGDVVSLRGRLIDNGLSAVEHCTIVYNPTALALSVNASCLHSFTVDDIDAFATFANTDNSSDAPTSCIVGRGSEPLIITLPHHHDFVIACESDPLPLVAAVARSKRERKGKLVHYQLREFDTFVVDAVQSGTVRWREDDPPALIPFPHGRLDFLKFHANRSVMSKLSSFGDRSIELSTDAVGVCGAIFLDDEHESGAGDIDALHQRVDDIERAMVKGNGRKAASLALDTTPFNAGAVVIVSNAAIYVTERTGTLRLRIALGDLESALLVARTPDGARLTDQILILVSREHGAIWLTTKYAADALHRIAALPRPGATEPLHVLPMNASAPDRQQQQQSMQRPAAEMTLSMSPQPQPPASFQQHQQHGHSSSISAPAVHHLSVSADRAPTLSEVPAAAQRGPSPATSSMQRPALPQATADDHHSRIRGSLVATATSPMGAMSHAFPPFTELRSFGVQTSSDEEEESLGRRKQQHEELSTALENTPAVVTMLKRQVAELRDELKSKSVLVAMRQAAIVSAPFSGSGDTANPQRSRTPVRGGRGRGSASATSSGTRSLTAAANNSSNNNALSSSIKANVNGAGGAAGSTTTEWPLRFYASMLEGEVERLTNLELEQRVVALEEIHADDSIINEEDQQPGDDEDADDEFRSTERRVVRESNEVMRYNLREALRRERSLEHRCQRMEREMHHMQDAHKAVVDGLVSRGLESVEAHLRELRASREEMWAKRVGSSSSLPAAPWASTVEALDDVEDRVQQEVTVRLASHAATVASLTDELRKREEQIAVLGRELETYFSAAAATNMPSEHDRHAMHTCVAAIQRFTERAASAREVATLGNTKAGLESKVRALLRQIDDLKRSRDALVDEGRDVFGAIRDDVAHGPSAVEELQTKLDATRRLQNVHLLGTQMAELLRVVRTADEDRAKALELTQGLRAKDDELRKAESQVKQLSRDLAATRSQHQRLEKETNQLRVYAEESQQTLERAESKHRREVMELRAQLKQLRSRPGANTSTTAAAAGSAQRSRSRSASAQPSPTKGRRASAGHHPAAAAAAAPSVHAASPITPPPPAAAEAQQQLGWTVAPTSDGRGGSAGRVPPLDLPPSPQASTALDFGAVAFPQAGASSARSSTGPMRSPGRGSVGDRTASTNRRALERVAAHSEALRRRSESLDRRSTASASPRRHSSVADSFGVVSVAHDDPQQQQSAAALSDPIAKTKERFARMKERLEGLL